MKIAADVMPFLQGEAFSNSLKVKVSEKAPVFDRISFLCGYAANKKIIHVGCVDHLPLISQKLASNTYLHQRLDKVAAKQFGIDKSPDGIEFMQKTLHYKNVAVEDILEGPINPVIQEEKWDCMILGEILEHTDNPVHFLSKVHERYKMFVQEIIITVPNALAISNTIQSLKNTEKINSDHRYWFSPYTLHKILDLSGFQPVSHEFATYYPVSRKGLKYVRNIFLNYLLKRNPVLRSDLIMIAKF